MASLKEIKTRINSVNSTKQITSAMKLISSSKLRKAQSQFLRITPYEDALTSILDNITEYEIRNSVVSKFKIAEKREVKKLAIVVITSNTTLCGSFNASVIRYFENVLKSHYKHLKPEDILLIPIGKLIKDHSKKLDCKVYNEDLDEFLNKPDYNEVSKLSDFLIEQFLDEKLDKIEIIYQHFKNKSVQLLTHKTFLPYNFDNKESDLQLNILEEIDDPKILDLKNKVEKHSTKNKKKKYEVNYLLEPNKEVLMDYLIKKVIRMSFYYIILDSIAAEHAARTIAMQIASDNADELLYDLNLEFNKTRQQQITNELLDLIGGNIF